MDSLGGHSIIWRTAVGPQAGRKMLTLQALAAGDTGQAHAPGNVGGFSLHVGVAVRASQRNKRERVPHHQPSGAIGVTPVAHRRWQSAPDARGAGATGQGIGWTEGCPRRYSGDDE
jgi:hypothetical protein